MIFCNGIPKSGTHALMKAVGLLGFEREPGIVRTLWNDHPLRLKPTDADPKVRGKSILQDPSPKFVHTHCADKYVDILTKPHHRVIYIIRDPRNVVVSYMRYQVNVDHVWDECNSETLIKAIKEDFYGGSLFEMYIHYRGWLWAPNTLLVRYENLISNEHEFRKIAHFLRADYSPEMFAQIQGPSSLYSGKVNRDTWTGKPSSWEDWWDEDVNKAWVEIKGPQLLEALGYGTMGTPGG